MASPKPLDLSTAQLVLGGFSFKHPDTPAGQPEITARTWVIIVTEENFKLCSERQYWQRWLNPRKELQKVPHWRKVSRMHQTQLSKWLREHPDYVPDTQKNKHYYGLGSALNGTR